MDFSTIYAQQLVQLGLGEPLWQPEPTQNGEVLIGDVGFMSDGAFHRLFNAVRGADDPANASLGVPSDFVQLKYNESVMLQTLKNFLPRSLLYNSSKRHLRLQAGATAHATNATYQFSCHRDEGAFVVLGEPATRSTVVGSCRAFPEYIRTHHDSWQTFAHNVGYDLERSEIVLVYQWIKTSSWALAACSRRGRAHELSIEAQACALAGVNFHIKVGDDVATSIIHRSGPLREKAPDDGKYPHDQCLFVKVYKMKPRKFLRNKLVASGSRHQSTIDKDEQNSTNVVIDYETELQEEPGTMYRDPIDDLLDYILLQASDAWAAIASHDDLLSLCPRRTFTCLDDIPDIDWPSDWPAFLLEVHPCIELDAQGVASIRSTSETYPEAHIPDPGDHVENAMRPSAATQPPLTVESYNSQAPTGEDLRTPGVVSSKNDVGPEEPAWSSPAASPHTAKIQCSDEQLYDSHGTDFDYSPSNAGLGDNDTHAADNINDIASELLRCIELRLKAKRNYKSSPPRSTRRGGSITYDYTCNLKDSRVPCESSRRRRLDPAGKYSNGVLATAPAVHIFVYRACAKWGMRSKVGVVAHVSIGVTAGTMLYQKRRSTPVTRY